MMKMIKIQISFLIICLVRQSLHNPDAKRLYDDLLSNYNRLIRPVPNNTDIILVKLGLRLSQLIELNLKDQILTTNVWLEHEWEDHKFKWDPSEYGGVTELYVPSEHIWLPDIVLYNNADGDYVVTTMTKAVISYTGTVQWDPPTILKSSCEIDVRYFPFDQQTCFMKFGSWTYDGYFIDLKHINQNESDMVDVGIYLKDYYPSVEWDILEVPAERHIRYYPCCDEPFLDIFFNITLRRKTLFYTVNLIIPCVGISYLSILVFYLPADSGEKIALSISILLSQTMFFLLISEIIPSTSLSVPLLGKYLLFTMLLIGLCVILTIIILNIHHRKPSTHKMSPWTRYFFMRFMPKLLCMRIPNNLLQNFNSNRSHEPFRSHDVNGYRSNNSLSSHTSSASSLASITKNNKKFDRHNSNKATQINDMIRGYNGFQSIFSELEGTIRELPRRKYPLELEKAIYNVMFIQNHMQRMDEFNAEDQDWAFIAMVMDRLFLWLFLIASILGTWLIITDAPALYDNTQPIDIALSTVFSRQNVTAFKMK